MISTFIFSREVRSVKVRFLLRNYTRGRRNCRLNDGSGRMDSSDMHMRDNVRLIREFIPPLTTKLRKGECGRIGVIGGSIEYTGAPYYSAISALKIGADVAYIICCKDAAIPIKSYSPAVIVCPYLDQPHVVDRTSACLEKVHCLVIGPGLGREPDVFRNVESIIKYCNMQMTSPIPLIIDADGLYLVAENPDLIRDYRGLVFLTPNAYEFSRLCDNFGMKEQHITEMSRFLNVLILKKGEVDIISNGICQTLMRLHPDQTLILNKTMGSKRRCAGQGDILAGCLATFVVWYMLFKRRQLNTGWNIIFSLDPASARWDEGRRRKIYDEKFRGLAAAAFGASMITRQASQLAFFKMGRSVTACDIIKFLPASFNQFFS